MIKKETSSNQNQEKKQKIKQAVQSLQFLDNRVRSELKKKPSI